MKFSKIVAVAPILGTFIICCGKSKKSGNTTTQLPNTPVTATIGTQTPSSSASLNKMFLASNVILGGQAIALAQGGSEPLLDSTTKLLPEQIQLNNDGDAPLGRLISKNLRDALQKEVAAKLSDVIVGKWAVQSAGLIPLRPEMLPAQFDTLNALIEVKKDGSISLESGCMYGVHRFLCKGYGSFQNGRSVDETACVALDLSSPTYKIYSNSIVVISTSDVATNANGNCNTSASAKIRNAALVVAELTQDKIVLFNSAVDSDSSDEHPEVMILTRVP